MKFNSNLPTMVKPTVLVGLLLFYVYIIGSYFMNNFGAEGMQEGDEGDDDKATTAKATTAKATTAKATTAKATTAKATTAKANND